MKLTVRDSRPGDIAAITAIYGHAVQHGLASFEYDPPDNTEMARRREAVLGAGYPYLVAEDEAGQVLGYAYYSAYRPRQAYRFSVENAASIGLHAACGFKHAGLLPNVGWKHGRWVDSILMTLPLGEGASSPPAPGR